MYSNNDFDHHSHALEAEKYTVLLGIKELVILSFIFFIGLSGLSLCSEKLFSKQEEKIDNIIIHEADFAQINITGHNDFSEVYLGQ
jgi:hypothetical protein